MITAKNTTVRWHKYTAGNPALPPLFVSVLVRKGGPDGAFIGVFSAYCGVGGDEGARVWQPYNFLIDPSPVELGDWWAEHTEAPV
jgi:hypothetical protein